MLRRGSRGSDVEALQQRLADAGFDPGPIDGIFGPRTEAALIDFQESAGVEANGVHDDASESALQSVATDEPGEEGATEDGEPTLREIIEEDFPSYAWALDHPDLGPILEEAAADDWDATRLSNALQGTDWWQERSVRARTLEITKQTDPGEYRRMVRDATNQVETLAQDLGVEVNPQDARELALQQLTGSIDQRMMTQAILGKVDIDDEEFSQRLEYGDFGGAISGAAGDIEQISNQYLLELTPAARRQWVEGITSGEQSIAGFREYAEQMALSQMPFLESFVSRGLAPQQALQPYEQVFARMLDITPGQVDWKDERFQRTLRVIENGEERLASTSEMATRIRAEFHDEWDRSSNARQAANQLTTQLADMFGRRA